MSAPTTPDAISGTLPVLVASHARTAGSRIALTFLPDPRDEEARADLTYAELDRAARRIGERLCALGAAGRPVLLLHGPGLEFAKSLLGCLYAGAVAVPAPMPGRQRRDQQRLAGIVHDCGTSLVVTDASGQAEVRQWIAAEGLSLGCEVTDSVPAGDPDWSPRPVAADDLALLQYTSGSTSDPKGVMVSHDHLVHNARDIAATLGSDAGTRFGGWLPHYHDLGLMGMLLQPLFHGGSSVFMAPVSFVKRPLSWLEMIDRHDIHFSGSPDFGYALCVSRLTDAQISGLDLSRWRVAVNGAEPVRARTIADFTRRLAPAGLRPETMLPCYGMAEATLIVTGDRPDRVPVTVPVLTDALQRGELVPAPHDEERCGVRELVGSGPVGGRDLLVVDPAAGTALPDGRTGEIWVRARNVAGGYWARPEATAGTFGATTADGRSGYLRTGDIGVVHEGELFVTGRLKDVLVVKGRNLNPQEIEDVTGAVHPALTRGAAAAFCDEDERVVVVQEIRPHGLGPGELADIADRAALGLAREFGIGGARILLARPGTVLRTTSGKIRRSAMRDLHAAGELRTLQPAPVPRQTTSASPRRAAGAPFVPAGALVDGPRP
ncbi:fatty acyl-AMP ligase [Streptomyces coacervatus]|uniref:Fatty acyl-AMP ligase n=1 Tax=Streptomyces coacervatus TaxID=647381 RepID=A0ABP7IQQ0_9ACTN|nr:fatty acyl-AMP ligase [Streptomyces coacervatus]MDF2266826.1 fatty acyl-AMP ligase [Streptomyces coacervatus]